MLLISKTTTDFLRITFRRPTHRKFIQGDQREICDVILKAYKPLRALILKCYQISQ